MQNVKLNSFDVSDVLFLCVLVSFLNVIGKLIDFI